MTALRDACVQAAIEAYEDAGIRGLCAEGSWEAAVAAMRAIDPERLLGGGASPAVERDRPDEHLPAQNGDASDVGAPGCQRPTRDLTDHDLYDLMVSFYTLLERDALVGPYFAAVDMPEHLPRIVAFWSTALFRTRRYSANAFLPHQRLEGLRAEHFERWIATLERTVDARFRGPVAEEMKTIAHRIAYSMQLRLGIPPFAPYRAATIDTPTRRGGEG